MNADTLNGTAEDASIWAARLDYAVASNLNIYGSFFWADRTSKSGYGWGFIRPDTAHPGMVTWADRAERLISLILTWVTKLEQELIGNFWKDSP